MKTYIFCYYNPFDINQRIFIKRGEDILVDEMVHIEDVANALVHYANNHRVNNIYYLGFSPYYEKLGKEIKEQEMKLYKRNTIKLLRKS